MCDGADGGDGECLELCDQSSFDHQERSLQLEPGREHFIDLKVEVTKEIFLNKRDQHYHNVNTSYMTMINFIFEATVVSSNDIQDIEPEVIRSLQIDCRPTFSFQSTLQSSVQAKLRVCLYDFFKNNTSILDISI